MKHMRIFRSFRDSVEFFKGFVKDPLSVGSLVPSSQALAEALVDPRDFSAHSLTVEIGTGTGAMTKRIFEKIPSTARYLGLDLNADFIATLSEKYPGRRFLAEGAENLPEILERFQYPRADLVVSGLPWTLFRPELQKELLHAIYESLDDRGVMVTFVYLHVLPTPLGKRFLRNLQEHFPNVERSAIVLKNLPSAAVFRARKLPKK